MALKRLPTIPEMLLMIWITVLSGSVVNRVSGTPNSVRLELTSRNHSQTTEAAPPAAANLTVSTSPLPLNASESVSNISRNDSIVNTTLNFSRAGEKVSARQGKSLIHPKINGVLKGEKRNPEELIRKALINHTLEHGGEEDLDKLVFSSLPQGSKLILRTVKIIRTDENGDPINESEETQPTYWDVTLANATDPVPDEEEDVEDYSGEEVSSEEEEGEEPEDTPSVETPDGKSGNETKKPDLESSGSHSSANYHHLNTYGVAGRDKELGKTHYHGNTHGNTHKQTHTYTDGKNVKPYHGSEKGLTDYANDQGKQQKNEGERFKTSKRKNKGRKVSGFKRVYHKEEFQRTEHFFDDEEANRIAESFGLSESKEGNNHGTKGDKRKYHGVRTEYLDGKKLKNEHGTHDGYDKGQKTTYKDSEKHSQHSDYGKSMSHSHGNSPHPQQHHTDTYYNKQQRYPEHTDYHPNHNYHGSYSSPRKNTLPKVPTSVADQIGHSEAASGTIVSAPMATSFTVTEYSPAGADSSSTPDPNLLAILNKAITKFPLFTPSIGNFSNAIIPKFNRTRYDYDDSEESDRDRKRKPYDYDSEEEDADRNRKRKPIPKKDGRENKMFFSPKHRPVKEDDSPAIHVNKHTVKNFKPVPSNAVPYEVPIPPKIAKPRVTTPEPENTESEEEEEEEEDVDTRQRENQKPYAPNFGPPLRKPPPRMPRPRPPPHPTHPQPQQVYHHQDTRRLPKAYGGWPGRHKRPRLPHQQQQQQRMPLGHETAAFPVAVHQANQVRMVPEHLAVRHSSAYNKLGNRARYNIPYQDPYQEVSTRKSDTVYGNHVEGRSIRGNSPANEMPNPPPALVNQNLKYTKNVMTSTTSPSNSITSENDGIRNTLIDPVPGVYSTVIKVLPATMITVNESTLHGTFEGQHPNNAITSSGNVVSVTRRPQSQADIISITTEFPTSQHRPPKHRPFIPKGRWLSLNFNLGNNFNRGPPPPGRNGKRMNHVMQGLKNGLLKPFGRGPLMPHHGLLASPGAHSPAFHRKVPFAMSAHYHPKSNHPPPPFHRPQLHPMNTFPPPAKNPPYFDNSHAHLGVVPQSSKEQIQSIAPPVPPQAQDLIASNNKRPRFYYKPITSKNQTTSTESADSGEVASIEMIDLTDDPPAPKVVKPTVTSTARSTTTITSSASSTSTEKLVPRKQPPQSPAFMNGLMDSVAGFFGKMG